MVSFVAIIRQFLLHLNQFKPKDILASLGDKLPELVARMLLVSDQQVIWC